MANSVMGPMYAPQGILIHPRVYAFTPGYMYSPQGCSALGRPSGMSAYCIRSPWPGRGMDSFVCARVVSELRVDYVYVWYASVSE